MATARPQNLLGRALAIAALLLASTVLQLPVRAGDVPQISLKPSHGGVGTLVRVNGSGFTPGTVAVITWDGAEVTKAAVDDAGTFEAQFNAPDSKGGPHEVEACATVDKLCDAGQAAAQFTVEKLAPTATATAKPTPTETKQPSPTPTKTAGPSPTSKPTATPTQTAKVTPSPTPTPTATVEPPPIVIPPGTIDLPPVPWLNTANGPCAGVPFAQPYNLYDFERGLTYIASGERLQPPQGARSGTLALASVFDDFGSAGKPILLDFYSSYAEVAMFVGREQPAPGTGSVTALVTAYGWLSDGTVGVVASASRELEEAAIPTERCIHLTAPSGSGIRSLSIEYIDENGDSAYERRWVDDVVARGLISAPRTTAPSRISILEPANGSILSRLASQRLHVVADVHWMYYGRPTVGMRVNRTGPTNGGLGMTARRAGDGDPTHWILEAEVTADLIDDDVNEISVFLRPAPGTAEIQATTNFTLSAPVAGNLRVVAIEVNQAVQEPGNRVPLIADKRTVVRVYVQGTPDGRGAWGPVTGLLSTVTPDGTTRDHSPMAPTTPVSGPVSTYGTASQLVFLLDRAETVTGLLRLNVSLRPVAPRPQTVTDDDRMTTTVRFIEPLRYTAYGVLFSFPTGETNTWSKLEDFIRYVENVFPVSSAQIVPVPGIGTAVQMVNDINGLRDRAGSLQSRLPPDVSIFGLWPGTGTIPSLCDANGCQVG
jgi:hypothetical protein